MAGHYKQHIDHYKLPIKYFESKIFMELEFKFGDLAHKFYNKIYPEIFSFSYYLEWGEPRMRKFAATNNIKQKKLREIIETCVAIGFFDKAMYFNQVILTSTEIQMIWIKECNFRKRANLIIDKKYCLFDEAELKKKLWLPFTYLTGDSLPISPYTKTILQMQPVINTDLELPLVVGKAPEKLEVKPVIKVVHPTPVTNEPNESTKEVLEWIKVPYEERTEEFKKMHTKAWYESYKKFNNKIDMDSPVIRNSNMQMQFLEYKTFSKKHAVTAAEIDWLLNKMMVSGVPPASQVLARLVDFLLTERKRIATYEARGANQTKHNFNK